MPISTNSGKNGILYRTMAPITGVVYPMMRKSMNTAVKQNIMIFTFIFDFLRMNNEQTNTKMINIFSRAAILLVMESAFQMRG